MQIECILKRTNGTKATIGGTEYHFAPQPDGAHVATVADDAHAQRFLSIREGYRIYRAEKVQEQVAAPAPDDAATATPDAEPAAQPVKTTRGRKK